MNIHPDIAELVGEIDFDPDALREKYREERDKRIRDDGNEQYLEVTAEFSNYVDEPTSSPGSADRRSSTRSTSPSSAVASAVCSWGRACVRPATGA